MVARSLVKTTVPLAFEIPLGTSAMLNAASSNFMRPLTCGSLNEPRTVASVVTPPEEPGSSESRRRNRRDGRAPHRSRIKHEPQSTLRTRREERISFAVVERRTYSNETQSLVVSLRAQRSLRLSALFCDSVMKCFIISVHPRKSAEIKFLV